MAFLKQKEEIKEIVGVICNQWIRQSIGSSSQSHGYLINLIMSFYPIQMWTAGRIPRGKALRNGYLLIKMLIIGNAGVGKTSIFHRYVNGVDYQQYVSNIGIDFGVNTLDIDGETVKIQLWDTAGQERFGSITRSYYRGTMGIILTYDISDEESFLQIRRWIHEVEQYGDDYVQLILIGNKSDLELHRKISVERGQALADEFDIPFIETSAKRNKNVQKAFMKLTMNVMAKMDDDAYGQKEEDNDKINGNSDLGLYPQNIKWSNTCC